MELVSDSDIECIGVGSAAEAVERLQSQHFDCVVIDLNLPDMNGIELIRNIQQELHLEKLPIIVYTSNHLEHNDKIELENFSKKNIVKNAHSLDCLFDETALFLHRVASKLPDAKRRILDQSHAEDSVLAGRKVLVVDDDVRNIFALTSILERQKMNVISAYSGHEAIKSLEDNNDVHIILMDIMMPGIDGYETIRRIKQVEKYRALPIIALTAKAMKGDREKCIDAGASDYIAKPVNTEHLKSLLRVWLYRLDDAISVP
jgi:CheY-like chemotaxis protein